MPKLYMKDFTWWKKTENILNIENGSQSCFNTLVGQNVLPAISLFGI